MYSVEDLLISHGYRPSRDVPGPREDHPEGRRQTKTRTQAGHGLLNGYEDGPAAFAHSRTSLGKGHVSDSESRSSTPRGPRERQRASASGTSQAGFDSRPTLAWSSQPPIGSDQVHWKRGPEASSVPSPRDRETLEVRGAAQAHPREGPWEVGGRTEQVTKKAVREEEARRMASPAAWQHSSLASWKQPRRVGRQMSDGGGERRFRDLYPCVQGAPALTPQNRKKSQSLPRVLSPESLSCTEIPIPLHDGHLPGVSPASLHLANCAPRSESLRNPEKGGSSAPFPRPKFGKPLKPPASSSRQQSRGESDFQDGRQADPQGPFLSRSSDPRRELSALDSGVGPPVYVPPPSYRSPPLHIPNPYLEDTEPQDMGGQGQQQYPAEKAGAGGPLPPGSFATGNEYDPSLGSPRGLHPHPHPLAAYEGSIQYIPFDDPRIRHIRLTQLDDRPWNSGPVPAPGPAHEKRQQDGVFLYPPAPVPPSSTEKASTDSSPWWLWGQVPRDGAHGSFPDQRDHCVVRGLPADVRGDQRGHVGGQGSSPHPQSASTCEIQTKLRKFETGIQTKKSSKKKASETIFCLVSIPVKSEPHLPDTDTNNNDLKRSAEIKRGIDKSSALQEQSLLSMSSTDLELQALTGSMAGRAEFPKQDLGEPEEDKRTDDLRLIHLTRYRELKYSGMWPGHQYRDQQTQTSFPEESKSLQLPPAAELGELSSAAPTPKYLSPAASEAHMHLALASSDQKPKPNAPDLRGQVSLSPSSSSAFSRTSTNQASVPKGRPRQPHVDDRGHGASPTPKPEVVKGEATAGPCNSQQLFGQFLLKPVSRRPWDLISQLESFNKELQEEEESHHGSEASEASEDSEAEQQQEDSASRPGPRGFHKSSQEVRAEREPTGLGPQDPGFWVGREKSQPERWSEEPEPGYPRALPRSPGPLQTEDSRSDPFQLADGGVTTEQRHQGVVNGTYELVVSPDPVKRTMSSRPRDMKPVFPSYLADPRELPESQELVEFTQALGCVQLSGGAPPKVDGGKEGGTVVPLSLTNKSRGLSAPDLRSVGLTVGQEQSACEVEGSLGTESAAEIPPSESLQARAARILGIEVAVESLLPGARRMAPSQPSEPRASACSPVSPREESLTSSALSGGPPVTTDAFYGRRKCGWTESPLFVGERAPQASEPSSVDGIPANQATIPAPRPSPVESRSFEEKDEGTKPPFTSTLVHFVDRTSAVTGSEKRLRSPSKVIESLQEKLTSPPRRVDPDRMMRMKEVSSVSRMRCLSFRSADSTEEVEDLKATLGQAWQPGGLMPWRLGHPPPLSKGVSVEENGHLAAPREKKIVDQDFWGPDSYDPSRVERV